MTIRMISNGGHRYRNRMLQAGEEFEVDGRSDQRLMKALKWAKDADDATAAVQAKPDSTTTAPLRSLAPARGRAKKGTEAPSAPTNNDAANQRPPEVNDKVAEPASPTVPRGDGQPVGSVTSLEDGKPEGSTSPPEA